MEKFANIVDVCETQAQDTVLYCTGGKLLERSKDEIKELLQNVCELCIKQRDNSLTEIHITGYDIMRWLADGNAVTFAIGKSEHRIPINAEVFL